MPHLVLHSVWNLSKTVAIGDNPLYDSSFVEFMGSGCFEDCKWMKSRIEYLAKKNGLKRVQDAIEQITEYVKAQNLSAGYKEPTLWRTDDSNGCRKFRANEIKL